MGTHLSTTNIAKKGAQSQPRNVTQINKKKSIWRPSTKKDFMAQMNSKKPRLNSDLFPNFDQKQLFSGKPKNQRTASSIPKQAGSKHNFTSKIAEFRILDNSPPIDRIHTLHPFTSPPQENDASQGQAVKDMIFNSSLKKGDGGIRGGSIFDEHHASSSKEDPQEHKALDIILGENK